MSLTIETTYRPQSGSLPDRVLGFLEANPEEELTREDIIVKFNTPRANVETLLQLAVNRGCLVRTRNSKRELVWSLGNVKAQRDAIASDSQADDADDVLPVQQTRSPFAQQAAEIDVDPLKVVVRKGVKLQTPEEKRAESFDRLFTTFEVGDSAEFDASWETVLRAQFQRWSSGKKVRFIFAATEAGKVGMERRK